MGFAEHCGHCIIVLNLISSFNYPTNLNAIGASGESTFCNLLYFEFSYVTDMCLALYKSFVTFNGEKFLGHKVSIRIIEWFSYNYFMP